MTDLLQQFAAIPLWLQAVSTLPTTLLTWSILEYASHRWPMHRKTPWPLTGLFARHLGSHAVLHHGRYFRDSLEPKLAILDPAIQHVDMKVDGLRNVGLSAPFWLPLGYFVSWPAALTFAAVGLLQGLAWSAVHWQFHFPNGARWTRCWAFRFLRGRHEEHHKNQRTCFGVLLAAAFPIDWLMGTLRSKRSA